MLKKFRFVLILLCVLCLLTVTNGTTAPDIRAIRSAMGRIEQGSFAMIGEYLLIPNDCSGFELQFRPDVPSEILNEIIPGLQMPDADRDTGIIRFPLDERTTRWLFQNAYALSIGPDDSILWIIYFSEQSLMFVQHKKTLVLAAQSSARGVPDTDSTLRNALSHKLKISSEPSEGEVRWSPDSHFLFFNDSDRWSGVGLTLDDPYLMDTQTGEIFLIETGGSIKDPLHGTFRCILNGRFSMDGKGFYWYCRSYTAGTPSHFLMRYDLETGEQKTIYELKKALCDFCEVTENCLFLLETADQGMNLIRIDLSGNRTDFSEELISIPWKTCSFLPVVRGNVLLAVTPNTSGGTYMLPLTWNTPAASSVWYKIGSLEDNRLQDISMDEIKTEVQEAKLKSNGLTANAAISAANIKHAAAITGVTDLLLTIFIRDPVPDSWGGGFRDFNSQVILNTETLALFPIWNTGVPDGFRDSLIDGTCFLPNNYYGQSAFGLYYADILPETTFQKGEIYSSPYGVFMCRNEADPLVLSSVTLENRECTVDITASEDRYLIHFTITDYPEPEIVRKEFIVPEVLTVDRWDELKSAMGKKDQKKLSTLYTKIVPDKLDKRADKDEILAAYPSVATDTLYILIGNAKADNLEMAEELLKSAGYTEEDYASDMERAAAPRKTNIIVSRNGQKQAFPVRYVFSASDPLLFPAGYRIEELAGLCERIGKSVTANLASEAPVPIEDVILDKYDMGSVDFYVTVDHSEAEGSTLKISLTAIP